MGARTIVGGRWLRTRGLRTRTVLTVRSLRTRTVPARFVRARRAVPAWSPRPRLLRGLSERTAAELRSRGRVGSVTRRTSAPPWPARRGARAADAGRCVVGELPGTAHRVLGRLPRGARRYGPVRASPRRTEWSVRGARFSAEPLVVGIDRICLRFQVGTLRLRISAGRSRHVPGGPAVPTIHPVPPGLTFRAASRWRRAARLAYGGQGRYAAPTPAIECRGKDPDIGSSWVIDRFRHSSIATFSSGCPQESPLVSGHPED